VVEAEQLPIEEGALAVHRQHALEIAVGDVADVEAQESGADAQQPVGVPLLPGDVGDRRRQVPPPASPHRFHDQTAADESESQQGQPDVRGPEETVGIPQREIEEEGGERGGRSDEEREHHGKGVGPTSQSGHRNTVVIHF
jgi:hypothetical protein